MGKVLRNAPSCLSSGVIRIQLEYKGSIAANIDSIAGDRMTATPIESPHSSILLASLQFQGTSNDCGPYTTATVLNALRKLDIQAADLAQQMNKPIWRGPILVVRRVPNWATFPWGMVDVFRSYGLLASWRPFTPIQYLFKALGRGRVLMPMIGEWKPLWAHVMTLIAWDPLQGWGFANTQVEDHKMYWLSDKTFKTRWQAMGHLLVEVKNA